ncbi:hypothetical protein ED312_20255 [Sinomicrobium pectinilyticum]|uniref:Uncharacterized protein n=1 Tax=Sinomicrobium pectinilyticum TaxID=1084421 RepID=A0A3N0DRH4_SINP1|nr:hypothetical protein ED312_20255 [Sinomicrobium pectinilyticum]
MLYSYDNIIFLLNNMTNVDFMDYKKYRETPIFKNKVFVPGQVFQLRYAFLLHDKVQSGQYHNAKPFLLRGLAGPVPFGNHKSFLFCIAQESRAL